MPREPRDVDEWTDYQEAVLSHPARFDTTFVGGRQTGKTQIIAHASRELASNGDNILVVAPQLRMCHEISKRIRGPGIKSLDRTKLVPDDGYGLIRLLSSYNFHKHSDTINYDRIIVDEASYIKDTVLRTIINDDKPILLAGTPRYPDLGRFSKYARSDSCYTVRATSFDAPFIDREHAEELRKNMNHEQALSELYARYHTDDRGK
jgi:hypothetical protein